MAAAGIAGTSTHTVRPGETASEIASANGTTLDALVAANHLADPDLVVAGTTLVIPAAQKAAGAAPGAGTYTVKPGDTLSSIASATGTSVDALAAANGLADPHLIFAGRVLQLVGLGSTSDSTFAPNGLPSRLANSPSRLALRPLFVRWANRYGVPADLFEALTWNESGWQNSVVSNTGAVGIGQLMPQTVDFARLLIGDRTLDPADPEDNIRMSARFLGYILGQTHGDVATSVAAYYQGLRSVRSRTWFDDTKQYVAVVLALRPHFG